MNTAWLSFSTLAHEVILINSVYHEEKQDKATGKVSRKKKKAFQPHHCCPRELSAMMEMYIQIVQYASHWPYMAIDHLTYNQ